MEVLYVSRNYFPELVTGRYVRCEGTKRKGYKFRVSEAGTGMGRFAGKPGMGGTLREYMTDGAELPEELKTRAIASKCTEKWD